MTVATMPGLAVVRSLNRAQSAADHSCQPSAVSATSPGRTRKKFK
jgi:hypothetical protein